MPLPKELNQQIVELLSTVSNMHDQNGRQAFIQSAGLDFQLQQQINYSGPPGQFTQLLVSTLDSYGTLATNQDALETVLEAGEKTVGGNKKALYADAIDALRAFRRGQYVPPLAGNQQQQNSPPAEPFSQQKRAALEAQKADLIQKYQAANTQLTTMLDEVDKITVKNKIKQIEREIREIQAELDVL